MNKLLFLSLGGAFLLLTGCSDGDDAQPPAPLPPPAQADMAPPADASSVVAPPPPAVAADPAMAPAAPAPGASTAIDQNVPGVLEGANAFSMPDLVNLNNAYQAFRSVEMRSPKDLNELVTSKQIQAIPPAPGGKKFMIDERNLRIILVNQ